MNNDPIFQHLQWIADAFSQCENAIPLPFRNAVRQEFQQRANSIMEEVQKMSQVAPIAQQVITK